VAAHGVTTSPATSGERRPRTRSPLRTVAVPTEHGGWSLTAEPALLGLLVAPSGAGLALAVAAMVAFVARTPLKVVLVDRWRGRWLERSRLAAGVLAAEGALIVALLAVAWVTAERPFWLPLLAASPLVVLELWFDMRSRSRRLLPELAGTVGIGSVAAAVALAGGEATTVAWGLWAVVAARGGASVPHVRTQVLRLHGRPAPTWHSDLAQVAGAAVVVAGWWLDAVPPAAAAAVAVVAALNLAMVRAAPKPAKVIGLQQTLLGVAVVVVTALAA